MLAIPPVSRVLLASALALIFVHPNAFAFGPVPPGHPPVPVHRLTAKPTYVFILVMDGGLPNYLKLADFPHLASLQRAGTTYTRAWDGMLETETPTGHASLGTGSLPRRHGIISFGWVTDSGGHVRPTDPIPIQQGQLEDLLKRSGVPSLASSLKAHDSRARVLVTSGHKDYAVDSVGGWAADYMMYYTEQGQTWTPVAIPRHVPPASVMQAPNLTAFAPHLGVGDQDSLAVRLAMSGFQQLRPTVTIVNLPEFDWPLGHLRGGAADSHMAWQLTSRLDADVANLEWQLSQDHVLGKTLFVLTADHGMLTLNHQIGHDMIQNTVQSTGNSLNEYEFHTSGYLWLKDPAGGPKVAEAILNLRNPYIRAVYYRLPGSTDYHLAKDSTLDPATDRAYQWLFATMAGPSAPHVVIVLRENSSIQGRNQLDWHGDHGGVSWNAERIPLILAGPGIRHGAFSRYPATIYDIAPTILGLLGASSRGMDGVVLNDALTAPQAEWESGQTHAGAERQPVQEALVSQSKRDGP